MLELYLSDKRKLQLKSVEYLEAFGGLMTDFFGADRRFQDVLTYRRYLMSYIITVKSKSPVDGRMQVQSCHRNQTNHCYGVIFQPAFWQAFCAST